MGSNLSILKENIRKREIAKKHLVYYAYCDEHKNNKVTHYRLTRGVAYADDNALGKFPH
jgi:hypothetical protein